MIKYCKFSLIIILYVVSMITHAENYKEFNNLHNEYLIVCDLENDTKWNPKRCFEVSNMLSEYGHNCAKFTLGQSYLYGYGVLVDQVKGKYWIEKSANNGNVTSVHALANLYASGVGCDKNIKKAIYLYEKILSVDDNFWKSKAMINLAQIYFNEEKNENKYKLAFDYLLKAKKLDNIEAYVLLGDIYSRGIYVKKDYKKSLEYFNYAASKGHEGAMEQLGHAYQYGKLGLEKNVNKASEWYSNAIIASNNSDLRSITLYANLLVTEFKGEENAGPRADGFKYLKYTANKQYKWAQELLAKYYANGVGTPVDKEKAEYWSKMAEKNPNKNYD